MIADSATKVLGGATSILPGMAGGKVVTSLAGRLLGTGKGLQAVGMGSTSLIAAGQSGGGTYSDAYAAHLQRGLPEAEARKQALKPAVVSALITGVLTRAGGARGVESIFRSDAGRALVKKTLWERAKAVGLDIGEESLEEGTDTLLQGINARLMYDPDKPLEEILGEAFEAAWIGGVLGGSVSAVTRSPVGAEGSPGSESRGSNSISDSDSDPAQQSDTEQSEQETTTFGEGRFPEVLWAPNADGSVRTKEEGVELAKKWGVTIPDDIAFEVAPEGSLGTDVYAQYGGWHGVTGQIVRWKNFYTLTGKIVVRLDKSLLKSDEGLVGLIGHEMHELNNLRSLFENAPGRTMTIDRVLDLTSPKRDGILHLEAWGVSDKLIKSMRNKK